MTSECNQKHASTTREVPRTTHETLSVRSRPLPEFVQGQVRPTPSHRKEKAGVVTSRSPGWKGKPEVVRLWERKSGTCDPPVRSQVEKKLSTMGSNLAQVGLFLSAPSQGFAQLQLFLSAPSQGFAQLQLFLSAPSQGFAQLQDFLSGQGSPRSQLGDFLSGRDGPLSHVLDFLSGMTLTATRSDRGASPDRPGGADLRRWVRKGPRPRTESLLSHYPRPSIMPTRRTTKAASHATAHWKSTMPAAHLPPSSRRIAAMAATQGVYSRQNTSSP